MLPYAIAGGPILGLIVAVIYMSIARIPDMMRTATNLLRQISAAVLIDRWTGAKDQPGG